MNVREVGTDDSITLHVGVAVSSFNQAVTDGLLAGCLDALDKRSVSEVTVLRVAGALELPVTCSRLADAGCDAVIAIGAVIEGETDHYRHVASQTAAGLMDVSVAASIPVTNAVLTVRDAIHAHDRSQPDPSNKGYEAAMAAVDAVQAFAGLEARGGAVSR